MKKLAVFFILGVAIISIISVVYINYMFQYNKARRENKYFSGYEENEIYGNELATIINKAVDDNIKNEVQKDNKGKYINNNKNSINIDIKITDTEKTYPMEIIYGGGMDRFVKFYNVIKFKCIKLEYHKATGKVKYMLFEQIT